MKNSVLKQKQKICRFSWWCKKGDWDVGLAVDAIKLASKLDAVVLVSGDGDYVPMVEYLQNMGTQVEAISFGKSTSGKLRESVDDFIDLSLNPRKYLISRGKIPQINICFAF